MRALSVKSNLKCKILKTKTIYIWRSYFQKGGFDNFKKTHLENVKVSNSLELYKLFFTVEMKFYENKINYLT